MIQNAKEELLECLAEECSEVIKVKSKIVRFGQTPERLIQLKGEIADVMACISMLFEEMEFTEAEQQEMFRLGEASMKKRYEFMQFKPRVRHQ